jgi:cytochrome c-type biogenesis protein CcmH
MKSLALAGLEATERADRGKATEYWERLKKVAPADSPDAKMAESKLAEMRAGTGGKAAAGTDAAPKSAPAKKSAP